MDLNSSQLTSSQLGDGEGSRGGEASLGGGEAAGAEVVAASSHPAGGKLGAGIIDQAWIEYARALGEKGVLPQVGWGIRGGCGCASWRFRVWAGVWVVLWR